MPGNLSAHAGESGPRPELVENVEVTAVPHSAGTSPRDDAVGGVLWTVLGAAILVGSWRMDRLEAQDINPYTIPGLVPGLLGLAMIFFGGLMTLRGARQGGFGGGARHAPPLAPTAYGRLAIVLVLCIGLVVVLLGKMPFWGAATIYVTVSIGVLRYRELEATGRLGTGLLSALVIGLGAGWAVTLVFEKIFLVRLP